MKVGKTILYAGSYELRYSARGQPFYVWKMPRINDKILDSVVYMYPSVDDAEAGEAWGGTGFLISVDSEMHEGWNYTYCVTNSHIIREAASPVIRLNTKDGGMDVIELTQDDWVHHQDGDDLAMCPITLANPDFYKYTRIDTSIFVTKEFIEQQSIGPGDEVFMVGRFVNHQGRQRNTPVVRFGNISMLPSEPILTERGLLQESFLIETRSLSGFSGSPVFLYITPITPVASVHPTRKEQGTWLLGVDWGHMRTFEKVLKRRDPPAHGLTPVNKEWMVPSNSGQMQIVPAWKLQELIDQEDMVVARRRADEEIAKRKEESPAVFDAQTAEQSSEDRPIFTENDFEDALDRVSRREPPPDQES